MTPGEVTPKNYTPVAHEEKEASDLDSVPLSSHSNHSSQPLEIGDNNIVVATQNYLSSCMNGVSHIDVLIYLNALGEFLSVFTSGTVTVAYGVDFLCREGQLNNNFWPVNPQDSLETLLDVTTQSLMWGALVMLVIAPCAVICHALIDMLASPDPQKNCLSGFLKWFGSFLLAMDLFYHFFEFMGASLATTNILFRENPFVRNILSIVFIVNAFIGLIPEAVTCQQNIRRILNGEEHCSSHEHSHHSAHEAETIYLLGLNLSRTVYGKTIFEWLTLYSAFARMPPGCVNNTFSFNSLFGNSSVMAIVLQTPPSFLMAAGTGFGQYIINSNSQGHACHHAHGEKNAKWALFWKSRADEKTALAFRLADIASERTVLVSVIIADGFLNASPTNRSLIIAGGFLTGVGLSICDLRTQGVHIEKYKIRNGLRENESVVRNMVVCIGSSRRNLSNNNVNIGDGYTPLLEGGSPTTICSHHSHNHHGHTYCNHGHTYCKTCV